MPSPRSEESEPPALAALPDVVSSTELLARLEALCPKDRPALVAFDGDGTLWTGDVGEDVFLYAVRHGLLHSDALEALRIAARRHGISPNGTASQVAAAIFDAYCAGSFPEREVCAVMTYCYAGRSEADFARLIRQALRASRFQDRLNHDLDPILNWVRANGVRAWVVSASPQHIVEEAASSCGFVAAQIIASRPAVRSGRLLPELSGEVPYAEAKCTAIRRVLGPALWLASFGDNVFDFEMLREASLGVAVRPKPRLLERLGELPNTWVFE